MPHTERLRKLEAAFVSALKAFAASPEMLAIRWALPYSFAGLAVGLATFMALEPGGTILERFYHSFLAAFAAMSAALVVLLSADLARRRNVEVAGAVALAVGTFALALPWANATSFESLARALGSSGLFLAIVVAIVAVDVFAALRARLGARSGWLVTAVAVFGFAGLLRVAGISVTGLLDAVIAPLGGLGDSLTALLLITLIETLLWTVGIHGPALLAAVVLPVYLGLQAQNTEAFARGLPLPHIVTVSTFLFVFPGGAGATLPLVLWLLRLGLRRERTVAFAALVPAIFNMNEPLMFGLPVVLNPYLGVPFVVTPLILAVVTWSAMHLGLVNRPALYIPSSIPLPISVFIATKDWRAIVLVAINFIIAAAVYLPFVALLERHRLSEVRAENAE